MPTDKDVEKTINIRHFHSIATSPTASLTALRSNLHWRTLRSLLALNPAHVTLCRIGGGLCLLGLLNALRSSLLLFAGGDGGLARGLTGFGTLRAALLDYIERGANDGSLVLDCAARALLGNFLYARIPLVIDFPWCDPRHDP